MPVFSYAFFQIDDRIYSFLKREHDRHYRFDKVLFNEDDYLSVNDKELWLRWKEETSFCDSIDTNDFVFILPSDSVLRVNNVPGSASMTTWNRENIRKFLDDKIGNSNISGTLDKGLLINNIQYKVVRYVSENLPDK